MNIYIICCTHPSNDNRQVYNIQEIIKQASCTHPCNDNRQVYNIQEIIKQASKGFMKVKNKKLVEITISTLLIKNL